MKIYKCDRNLCDNVCNESEMITLNGYTGLSGGILLPDAYQEKHFCSAQCFEVWIVLEAKVGDEQWWKKVGEDVNKVAIEAKS